MYFNGEVVKKEFNLPDNLEPVLCLLMGYSDENGKPSIRHNERKDIKDIVKRL